MVANSQSPLKASLVERTLAITAVTLAAVAFVCLVVVFAAPMFGVEFGTPPAWYWDVLLAVGYYGIPIAFALVVLVIILRTIANRRANREV